MRSCRAGTGRWNIPGKQFQLACYTDIYPLYFTERLANGKVPYTGHPVEYPVLIGAVMQAAAWLVRSIADPFARGQRFFDVTVAGLAVCAIVGVLATAYAAGPARRRDALLVALSPALILSAFINWDLVAMALVAAGMAAWAARRNVLAGVLLGLAVATKFYPLVFFGPLLLLCLRAGRMRAFWVTTGSAALAWLAVNVPVMLAAPAGWRTFYSFSRTRPADWGAIWYFFETRRVPLLGTVNLGTLNDAQRRRFRDRLRGDRGARARRAAPPTAATVVLPRARGVPAHQQGVVAAVRDLAGTARGARHGRGSARTCSGRSRRSATSSPSGGTCSPFQAMSTGVTGFHGIGQGWYFTALLARFATTALLAALVVADILRPGRRCGARRRGGRPGRRCPRRCRRTCSCCAAVHAPAPLTSTRELGGDRATEARRSARRAGRSRSVQVWSAAAELVAQPADVRRLAIIVVRRLADDRRSRGSHHLDDELRVDGAALEVVVPVAP